MERLYKNRLTRMQGRLSRYQSVTCNGQRSRPSESRAASGPKATVKNVHKARRFQIRAVQAEMAQTTGPDDSASGSDLLHPACVEEDGGDSLNFYI